MLKKKRKVTYIATGLGSNQDKAWQARLKKHINRRPDFWQLIESNVNIVATIKKTPPKSYILIDSLGGLVYSQLKEDECTWNKFTTKFISLLSKKSRNMIIVSEEVGWSVIPYSHEGYIFRERLTLLSESLSKILVGLVADESYYPY